MMKKIILVFILFSAFLLGISLKTHANDEMESFRLVVLGDSLAAGYGLSPEAGYIALLKNVLKKDGLDNVSIIDAAVAGQRTSDGLAMMPSILAKRPHAAIVELGINDALQGVNGQEIQKNLETIVSMFLNNDIPVMLIGVKPPVVSAIRNRDELPMIYKAIAKKYKLAFYPHFLDGVLIERMGTYDFKYLQNDTVHPNEAGVYIMLKKTYPVIKKFLMSL